LQRWANAETARRRCDLQFSPSALKTPFMPSSRRMGREDSNLRMAESNPPPSAPLLAQNH
jgi:hypothetical protein